MSKSYMTDDAVAEKSGLMSTCTGPVKELIRDHEIGRSILFLQAADRRNREDVLNTQQFHCVNVCAEGQFTRRQTVSTTVPGQKGNRHAVQFADDEGIGRRAKRGFH